MLQLINIPSILLLFLFGAAIAMLGMAFQAFMKPGNIFTWYGIWLNKVVVESKLETRIPINVDLCYMKKAPLWKRIIAAISKPLGLCPYCNTTWIAIIFHIIYFGISFNIFLLIGIVWFFVMNIIKIQNRK